jgi:hypothetical protein
MMSRNEVKNINWGSLSKCPLSGQATAGICGDLNGNQ